MKFNRSKKTKRFNFNVSCNSQNHKTGANTLTIKSRDVGSDTAYSYDTAIDGGITMTVKEARALQGFLNKNLGDISYS